MGGIVTVKVSYSHDVQAATALIAGTPQCAFTCLVFLHSLTFSLGDEQHVLTSGEVTGLS